ncbi:hypothetical protein SAY87_010464 [Trapa incisa]|uniref:HNH nuclease domain-containing protein n=1 Tax=Trapa incisa TaxID=236973 RepID=A0AAN7GQH5_9MYRT|nr:hypothetical protein SAY87_010464 [Trapa incisa]
MKPSKQQPRGRARSRRTPSPPRGRTGAFPPEPSPSILTPSSSAIYRDLGPTAQEGSSAGALFENLEISFPSGATAPSPGTNPRSFPYTVKQQCWEKAEKVRGRDPDRWRKDAVGNIVFRKLVGCPGCLCHDYDHIVPYSKGGQSTLENCQVLQATVNRSKGNQTDISRTELIRRSSYCRVSDRDMDMLELASYGNVHRAEDSGGCRIQ